MKKEPPFKITNRILQLLQDISHELGGLAGAKLDLAPKKDIIEVSNAITLYNNCSIDCLFANYLP